MVQGAQQRIMVATQTSAGSLQAFVFSDVFRNTSQRRKNGRRMPSAGFVRSDMAQRTAYAIQSMQSALLASSNVIQRIAQARNADREVSQIHSKGRMMPLGQSAQSQAARAASRTPLTRRAAK